MADHRFAKHIKKGSLLKHLDREGVSLAYEEKGSGELCYFFIHGTGGDHSQVASQFEYFSKHGRVIAVDLRGHGQSDKPKQEYSIEVFADDIAWICSKLGVSKAVMVGASMGGNIAVELGAEHPDLVSAVVLLDSGLLFNHDVIEALGAYANAFKKEVSLDCIHTLLEKSFLHSPEKQAAMAKVYEKTPHYVWTTCFSTMLDWDKEKVRGHIRKIQSPILYLEAKERICDLEAFAELNSNFTTSKVGDSGHLVSLEEPEQVSEMIEKFLSH